ncbi:hypothetical protein HDU97_009610, partial [Phlyctochytrium planicorne]
RCPSTCPAAVENETRANIRYKYKVDENGRITGDAYTSAPFDITTRAWYTGAAKSAPHTPIWTDAYIFSNQIDIGITAAIPLFNGNGNTMTGVLATDMSFGILKEQLRSIPVTSNGFVLVFDMVGNLYGSSVPTENVTVSVNNVNSIKTIRQLTDPKSIFAMNFMLSKLPNNGIDPTTNKINLNSLPSSLKLRATSADASQDLSILITEVKDNHGIHVFILVGAPLRDYTQGIDDTGVTLRERLNGVTRLMLLIGAGLVIVFVLLSIPVTHFVIAKPLKMLARHMEEVARFDFGSLHGKDRNERSIIRELGVMQTAYWNMIMKFANGIQENRRLVQNQIKSTSSHIAAPEDARKPW